MNPSLTGLYAITDAGLMPHLDILLDHVEQSLRGGVNILQYRDKSTNEQRRLTQALALQELCNHYNVPLIINDDIELAFQSAADGVHLGQSDGQVSAARQRLGSKTIIGVTCHDQLPLAEEAVAAGADYVAFGAFFPSKSKPDAKPASLALLQQARMLIDRPIVAIGGISVDNAPQVIDAGADMIAVIHALYASADITQTAEQFSRLFQR